MYPRICEAFPKEESLLLYGNSEETYRYTKLTICTTHQLFYFYHAFDLLVIDEIDAFPYEGDARLYYASQHALAPTGQLVYLSATPSNRLLNQLSSSFVIEKLPMRFHKRPLIVPELIWYEHWETCYHHHFWLKKLVRVIKELLKKNNLLIFCPSIQYMKKLNQSLTPYFLKEEMTCVFAEDEQREEKVQKMREQSYRILFTTTILERGITFERVSVIVMGANHPVFSKSALVQIAGRVDRKGEFNNGRVIFFFNLQTQAIRQARKEIMKMNQLAKEWIDK